MKRLLPFLPAALLLLLLFLEMTVPSGCGRQAEEPEPLDRQISLTVNGIPLTVVWEENPSVAELAQLLQEGPLTIPTEAYGGFEQVGSLPQAISREDQRITAEAGDLVLYTGSSLVLFYGSNTWEYTRLGHIQGLSREELETLLSGDQATVVLSLAGKPAS